MGSLKDHPTAQPIPLPSRDSVRLAEKILVNITPQETRVAVLEDAIVQELHIERSASRGIVGNIYLGQVKRVHPLISEVTLVEKLKTQKGIVIDQQVIPGANHFFENQIPELTDICDAYVEKRLGKSLVA